MSEPYERETEIPRPADASEPPKPRRLAELAAAGLERARARKNKLELPIPLPWVEYGKILGGGLWPGLHILVGGTGAGKTTFATQIAIEAASQGFPTAYVGLELDEAQIGLRMLAEKQWASLYLGKHSDSQLAAAEKRLAAMAEWPLFAEMGDPNGWPASRIDALGAFLAAEAKELASDALPKPGLIVLDFLQLVGSEQSDNRVDARERIGRAAYRARQVARQHNLAVLVVSSAARDKYAALANAADGAGLRQSKDNYGTPYGSIMHPDAIVGTGKESGEIEYAADSVTVLMKYPNTIGQPVVLCCVPKLRYGRPRWFALTFEDQVFCPLPFGDMPPPREDKEANISPADAPPESWTCPNPKCGIVLDEKPHACPKCGHVTDKPPSPQQKKQATPASTGRKYGKESC